MPLLSTVIISSLISFNLTAPSSLPDETQAQSNENLVAVYNHSNTNTRLKPLKTQLQIGPETVEIDQRVIHARLVLNEIYGNTKAPTYYVNERAYPGSLVEGVLTDIVGELGGTSSTASRDAKSFEISFRQATYERNDTEDESYGTYSVMLSTDLGTIASHTETITCSGASRAPMGYCILDEAVVRELTLRMLAKLSR